MSSSPDILFLCTANYYRSRFAEMYFNHMAEAQGIVARADSAGLEMHQWRSFNPGELSPHSVEALRRLGIEVPKPYRAPKQFSLEMLQSVSHCIALSESEHRPMALKHFPDVIGRFEFWSVEDIGFEPVESALSRIQGNVHALIASFR
jgi:protein-tyrosine phosphatase